MADRGGKDDAAVAKQAGVVTARLDDKLGEITHAVQELLVAEISELAGDPQLVQLLRDTVAANVETFFSAIRNGIAIEHVEAPTAALEYARRLAQRGITANALVRAYRLGHQAVLKTVLSEVRASNLDADLGLDVYELMAQVSFDYIDSISQQVVATYQDERERWWENRNSLRTLKVREVLASTDIDVDVMTTEIRYPFRRLHLALIVWCNESETGDALRTMERFVENCAESIGAQESPLFIGVDRVTAWAWIPLTPSVAEDAVQRVRSFATADALHLAVGNPIADVEGFRNSHRQAQRAHIVAAASGAEDRRFIAASDRGVSLAALFGNHIEAALEWVHEVLGPLAAGTEGDERLRETLRVFLTTGSSYKAAAEELHLHSNSVKYRVNRAIERRGRPIDEDRLDVEVALLLCYWFDETVMS